MAVRCALWLFVGLFCYSGAFEYVLDTRVGLGRRFDGVGAISGGGATSKLLVNYPSEQQNDILDFLFKPNFGASLQILKVEIGGDAQSSEGTESSHMHNSWDENYERGYEWWLMTEAKRRNPDIRLCGLPWGFPGWLGGNSWDPYRYPNRTADYIARWIWGAKKYYGLVIDCVGIWNEKPYSATYIKTLRQTLDMRGFSHVKIVAADDLPVAHNMIVKDILRDPELYHAVDVVGLHYPATYSSDEAKNCSKPLWASEDGSSSPDENGAGHMARLLNQNYLNGYMTCTIMWNLINSYYNDLQYGHAGLMRANQPWSGYYEVSPPIWAAAHTTQFVKIGWTYLKHGFGVTALKYGGSMVSLISADHKDLTIVIETMDTSSGSFHATSSANKVLPQNVSLVFRGELSSVKSLHLWRSSLYGNKSSVFFRHEGVVEVNSSSQLTLLVDVNSIYTLTTQSVGSKGVGGTIPAPKSFPLPYHDDFDEYAEHKEPYCFTSQVGSFEVHESNDPSHNKILRQVVLHAPIHWCPVVQTMPLGVIGNYNWSDVKVTVDIFVPNINATDGVFIGLRMDQASCTSFIAQGLFFFLLFEDKQIIISRDLERTDTVFDDTFELLTERWYTVSLQLKRSEVVASVDGCNVYSGNVTVNSPNGFVALGTDNFGLADFDNLQIAAV